MSRAAQDWAASRTGLDASIRWTLWHLADYASHDGTGAFPSIATLARLTGLSDRTVQRHLRELVEYRYLDAGDQLLTSHYPINRRPAVYDLRMQPGQPNGLRFDVPALFPAGTPAASTSEGKSVDNPPDGVPRVSPVWGDTKRRSGVTLLTPNPRTKKELTRARARGEAAQPCSPECDNPRIGSGRGWLADDPLTHAPVPCPVCRKHTRRQHRW